MVTNGLLRILRQRKQEYENQYIVLVTWEFAPLWKFRHWCCRHANAILCLRVARQMDYPDSIQATMPEQDFIERAYIPSRKQDTKQRMRRASTGTFENKEYIIGLLKEAGVANIDNHLGITSLVCLETVLVSLDTINAKPFETVVLLQTIKRSTARCSR